MSTTIKWSIAQLDRETADGYVFKAHYRVDANDGTYSSGAYGSMPLDRPNTLIPYKDLNEDTVIDWIKTKIIEQDPEGIAKVETALEEQITEQVTPTRASGIPWS
jgi:hypothetical protein